MRLWRPQHAYAPRPTDLCRCAPFPCAVTDLVALSIYVTKYAAKSEKASESFLSVLNYAVGDAPDGGSAAGVLRKVAIRCLSTGLSKRVITNQEAAMSLLQMPVQRRCAFQ